MQIILAESLNGWIFAHFLTLGGLFASLLALGAIIPAWKRHRLRAVTLAAPAFIVVVLVTLWAAYEYFTVGLGDPDVSLSDYSEPWLFLAGPSFATGVLAMLVLLFRGTAGDVEGDRVSEPWAAGK